MLSLLDVPDGADLDAATRARLVLIHEEAFLPEERQYSMAHMLGQAGRSGCILRIARWSDAVIGYTYLEIATEVATAFLWYMAVEPGMRNHGVGRSIVTDALDLLRREHPEIRLAMFEVHRPDGGHAEATQQLDRRRIEFYRRLGAFWVQDVDYRIPVAGHPRRSVAYDPMFFALRGAWRADDVQRSIVAMAADMYEATPRDPRWLQLHSSVGRMVIVPPADSGAPSERA